MISAFDVIGPAMVGPSSSHTAGACRIGIIARHLFAGTPREATIELHGSFASTGTGHATDRALVAGLLGFAPDDERIKDAFSQAATLGLHFEILSADFGEDAHPNSARLTVKGENGEDHSLLAASVGGGMVEVREVDGYTTSFGGQLETLLLWHEDKPGFLAKVTALLSCVEANIATIRTSRKGRGAEALSVIEVDVPLPDDCLSLLAKISPTRTVRHFSRLP
ncbi:MAG: L-serine ammonia-lyase, iron-sulfur-dependent, subunit beta [Chthoniobacterales bacterium]|nr:L-serine ammonia-lyase, iron-sulfur-dependent, subunit beta [Chthoniobacterales bacterium]